MLICDFHLTYTDSVAAAAGIRAASEVLSGVSLKGKNAVKTTSEDPAIADIETLRGGEG